MESGLGSIYKKKYCEGDKMACARYQVATKLGPEFVTNMLYPNMMDKAKQILAQNGKSL